MLGLSLANSYLVPDLKVKVERMLVHGKFVDEENVFYVLQLADLHSAHELSYQCLQLILDTPSLQEHPEYYKLPSHLRTNIRLLSYND